MSKKVVVLPLSLIVRNSQMDAVRAFNKLGVSQTSILWNWSKLNNIFDSYREGILTTKKFKQEITKVSPALTKKQKRLVTAWNKGCQVTPETQRIVEQLITLKSKGIEVIIAGNTNKLHVDHILSQLDEAYREDFSKMLYLSYENKVKAKELIPSLLKQIEAKSDIAMFYTKPKSVIYPNNIFGKIAKQFDAYGAAWLVAPIQKLFYRQATKYVHYIKTLAQSNKPFTLVSFPENNETLESALSAKMQWKRLIQVKPSQAKTIQTKPCPDISVDPLYPDLSAYIDNSHNEKVKVFMPSYQAQNNVLSEVKETDEFPNLNNLLNNTDIKNENSQFKI